MAFVVNGKEVDAPGVRSFSFLDDPSFRAGREDLRKRRTSWVRSVVLHTTLGEGPGRSGIIPVSQEGASGLALATIRSWKNDRERCASSQVVIDGDGTVYCVADLVTEMSFHATSINEVSIGVELCQDHKTRTISKAQLSTLALFCDWVSRQLGIQRQVHWPYSGPIDRLVRGGADCVGFFGHRDQTNRRGRGDPGDVVLEMLLSVGYEGMDFGRLKDIEAWKIRQRALHVEADGIPGPASIKAFSAAGIPHGMWVKRPGD